MRSLLAAFPHPDDETFATGGALARCHRDGVSTALFTATDGEAGRTTGVPVHDRVEAGRVRRRELIAAAGTLGIDRVFTPGYPDGDLGSIPADELLEHLVTVVRDVRPGVLLTFGPEGGPTGHRDHRALSRLVTAAFFLAGNATVFAGAGPPWRTGRLYYLTWPGTWTGPDGKGGLAGLPATCRIRVGDLAAVKRAAFAAHRSQQHHREEFETTVTELEDFHLAAGVPQPAPVTADFFAGLAASDVSPGPA
jgi:LmbE family N-acetylglucosaminyl deacetylase